MRNDFKSRGGLSQHLFLSLCHVPYQEAVSLDPTTRSERSLATATQVIASSTGDAITGDSYTGTHSVLIKEPNHQLLGVIFYIDGAVTGQFSDLPVTALRMLLTCFSRVARQRDDMWVTLGWVPQVKVAEGRGKKIYKESLHMDADEMEMFDGEGDSVEGGGEEDEGEDDDDEEADGMTDMKAQDVHKMISVILESYVKLQRTGFV